MGLPRKKKGSFNRCVATVTHTTSNVMFKKRTVKASNKRQKETETDSLSETEEPLVTKRARVTTPQLPAPLAVRSLKTVHTAAGTTAMATTTDAVKQTTLYKDDQPAERNAPTEADPFHPLRPAGGPTSSSPPDKTGSTAFNGPVKAAANVRSTTTIDFQPDICKDYKQTGYCGYGDTCKFLHIREAIKEGWAMEREWENVGSSEKARAKVIEGAVPFKCVICKQDYTAPVTTNCGHHFCEACFFRQYKVQKSCFVCGKDTSGIVKPAKDLQALLKPAKV